MKKQENNEVSDDKSEQINDLVRKAREQQVQVDFIKAKLEKAEKSGFTNDTKVQIFRIIKSETKL